MIALIAPNYRFVGKSSNVRGKSETKEIFIVLKKQNTNIFGYYIHRIA
jgi:hypothetical protein